MISIISGNLFESKAQTLVNTVNCVGVMGKGIALEFKKKFPDMYLEYEDRCRKNEVKLGEPYLYKSIVEPWVLNFPTKGHWRAVTKLSDIVAGLNFLRAHYKEWGIRSLAIPPLGCGLGQLEWRVVGPTLCRHLKDLDMDVELYAPFGTPHEELQPVFLDVGSNQVTLLPEKRFIAPASRIEPGWIALVEILRRIEQQPYHRPIGRISFQKIAYFATETGIYTGLQFVKGSFGPYAKELKGVVTKLVNNGLIHESKFGSMLRVQVGSTYGDAAKSFEPEIRGWDRKINSIANLFMRMDTQQSEIAATVHFAHQVLKGATRARPSETDVLKAVLEWKQQMPKDQVAGTIRHLAVLGWLDVKSSTDLPVKSGF